MQDALCLSTISIGSYCLVASASAAEGWRLVKVTSLPARPEESEEERGDHEPVAEGLQLDYLGDVHTLMRTFTANERKASSSPATTTEGGVHKMSGTPHQQQLSHMQSGAATGGAKTARHHGSLSTTASENGSGDPAAVVRSAHHKNAAASDAAATHTFRTFTEAVVPGSPKDVMLHVGILDQLKTILARGGLHSFGGPSGGVSQIALSSSPSGAAAGGPGTRGVQRSSLVLAAIGSLSARPPQTVAQPGTAGGAAAVRAKRALQHQQQQLESTGNMTTTTTTQSVLSAPPPPPPGGTLIGEDSSTSLHVISSPPVDLGLTLQAVNADVAVFTTPSDPATFASRLVKFLLRDVLCPVPQISLDVTVTSPGESKSGGGGGVRHSSRSPVPNQNIPAGAKKKQSVKIEDIASPSQLSPSPSIPHLQQQPPSSSRGTRQASSASKSIVDLQQAPTPHLGRQPSARSRMTAANNNSGGTADSSSEMVRVLLVDPTLLMLVPAMLHPLQQATVGKAARLPPAQLASDELIAPRLTRSILAVFKSSIEACNKAAATPKNVEVKEEEEEVRLKKVQVSFFACEFTDEDMEDLVSLLLDHRPTLESLEVSVIHHPLLSTDFTRVVPAAEHSSMNIERHQHMKSHNMSSKGITGNAKMILSNGPLMGSDRDDNTSISTSAILSRAPMHLSTFGASSLLVAARRMLQPSEDKKNTQRLSRLVLRHLSLDDEMVKLSELLSCHQQPSSSAMWWSPFSNLRHLDLSYNASIGDETLIACLQLLVADSRSVLERLLLAGNAVSDRGALEVQDVFLLSATSGTNALAMRLLDLRWNKITELCKETVLAPISVPQNILPWSRDRHRYCDRRVRRRVALVWMFLCQQREKRETEHQVGGGLDAVEPSELRGESTQRALGAHGRWKKAASHAGRLSEKELLLASFASFFGLFNRSSPIRVLF